MLIDDDPMVHLLNTKLIKKVGLGVKVWVEDGARSALELITEEPDFRKPCLILLDLNMPGWTGWDFLDMYQKVDSDYQKDICIVILSTSENPDDMARANANPAVDRYISKPLSQALILDLVKERWPDTLL